MKRVRLKLVKGRQKFHIYCDRINVILIASMYEDLGYTVYADDDIEVE